MAGTELAGGTKDASVESSAVWERAGAGICDLAGSRPACSETVVVLCRGWLWYCNVDQR